MPSVSLPRAILSRSPKRRSDLGEVLHNLFEEPLLVRCRGEAVAGAVQLLDPDLGAGSFEGGARPGVAESDRRVVAFCQQDGDGNARLPERGCQPGGKAACLLRLAARGP